MSDNLKTWPERIWLQHSEDGYPVPIYKTETDEITWCVHQQFDCDIEYVRADRIAELEREVATLQKDAERLDWLEQHDGRFYNMDKISSVVGSGFSSNNYRTRTNSLREAIDALQAGKEPK